MDAAQAKLIQEIEANIKYDTTKPLLSKELALKYIRTMEEKKIEAVQEIQKKTNGQMV